MADARPPFGDYRDPQPPHYSDTDAEEDDAPDYGYHAPYPPYPAPPQPHHHAPYDEWSAEVLDNVRDRLSRMDTHAAQLDEQARQAMRYADQVEKEAWQWDERGRKGGSSRRGEEKSKRPSSKYEKRRSRTSR